jgi:hypothetical protein
MADPGETPRRSKRGHVNDLPYFDGHVHFPNVRIEYEEIDGRNAVRGHRGRDDALPRRARRHGGALGILSVRRPLGANQRRLWRGRRRGGGALRREFACRLLESRAELHDVRDFLGHANITTTSRYLRSTPLRLERALSLLEAAEARLFPHDSQHSPDQPHAAGSSESEEPLDGEELELVSPEGIDLKREPEGRSGQADDFRGEPDRAKRELVSPEGIEPSTNRLRVCCSAN